MIRASVLSLLCWLTASLAHATPPRMFVSDDRIVAATQMHFYVLRDLVDNQGSHYSQLHDQHLVEIAFDNHQATRSWLLRSMAINNLSTDEYLSPGQVSDGVMETTDMFDVLRQVGAVPQRLYFHSEQQELFFDGQTLKHPKNGDVADISKVAKAARAQLQSLADAYPQAASEAELIQAMAMEVYDLSNEANWICKVEPGQLGLFRTEGELRAIKIGCDDDYYSGSWTFHMFLPEVIWH